MYLSTSVFWLYFSPCLKSTIISSFSFKRSSYCLESLDKWYTAEPKDYDAFAKQYPMNGELQNQSQKIALMQQWCEAEKITHTPTIFINGHELPGEYLVDDLKEVLTFE